VNAETSGWKTQMKELAPGVYAYIQAKGTWFVSNAGLIVGKEDAIVVDSLVNETMVQAFIAEIEKITDKPIRFLINTHHHSDHTWTNHFFPQARVICQSQCRELTMEDLAVDPKSYELMFPELSFDGARVTPQDITFEKELILHQAGRQIRLIHNGPAHTKGDIFVYLPEDGIVFCGDLLFYRCTPLALMGYVSGWIDAMDSLVSLDASTYVPGHGPITGRQGLLEGRDYLVYIRDEARKCFDAGMDAFEAARKIDLQQWEEWADSERIVANVERLYSEFRGEEPAAPLDAMQIFPNMMMLANGSGNETGDL